MNLNQTCFFAGSTKKAWWKCNKCGNLWESEIRTRVRGSGCPKCAGGIHVSKFELRVYAEIKSYFEDAIHGFKLDGVEIDIFIPSKMIGIEVDGHRWHLDVEKDLRKNRFVESRGVLLIRVREGLSAIRENDIAYHTNDNKDVVLKRILNSVGVCGGIIGEKLYLELLSDFRRVCPEKRLSITHPDLCLEWSDKNMPLKPDYVSMGSMEKVWWKCKLGHEWKARIDSRVNGNGCPVCVGRVERKVSDTALVKEWSKNNDEQACDVFAGSKKQYWWYCEKHNHHYKMVPHTRYYGGSGCPICSGVKPLFENSLASCAKIMAYWDYEKNKNDPETLKLGSVQKIWLKVGDGKSKQFTAREAVSRKRSFDEG